jgi:23S rRNA (uracil1939-C5)-methyltransferase
MTASEDAQTIGALADSLRRACPQLAGLFWSRVPGLADAAIPDRTEHLLGEPFIVEKLAGLEIPMGPRTFMQPNAAVAEILYGRLADTLHLEGTEKVLDLYCGVGAIGASLAGRVGQVYGVEKESSNVEMGQEMIRRNGLSNMRIAAADVESLRSGPRQFDQPDVIVVDPPRAGLTKRVLRYLHACNPRQIAYVSCNPKALKDNLQRFLQTGLYRPRAISAYDMFPHTPHAEVVCVLDRMS